MPSIIIGKDGAFQNGFFNSDTGNTLFYDSFTDSDGTGIASHTPDTDVVGNGWQGDTGSADIQSNQLRFTGNIDDIWVQTNESDVIITVKWTPTAGSRNSIILRGADESNDHIRFNIRQPNQDYGAFNVTNGTGSTGPIPRTTFAWNAGQTYDLKIVASGTNLEWYIDGNLEATGSTTFQQNVTTHGLRRDNGNNGQRFDDFRIQSNA
jgi:hypothetical protein